MPKLFALMVAIAMLFAPAFMNVSMAQASVPGDHVQNSEKAHCVPVSDPAQEQAPEMACCGAMCMAVAITPAAVPVATPLVNDVPVASLRAFQAGAPAELATPPPRGA